MYWRWQSRSAASAVRQWALAHIPESLIFLLGALLRLTMAAGWRFQAEWGYDGAAHWSYIQHLLQSASLPSCATTHVAYHPPLYHLAAAGLVKLGADHQGIIWLSFACGVARLVVIWLGLEWYLQNRRARIAALSLVAVMPVSIMIDGNTSNESMNGLLAAIAMLIWPKTMRATGWRQWRAACVLGLILGLGIITKTSSAVLLMAFGTAVLLDLALNGKHWSIRLRALAPWTTTVIICLTIGGWFYARNAALYGAPFATYYEIVGHPAASRPYLDRRSSGFLFGWSGEIYKMPYYPVALTPHPRFFPVALAETFTDYYNHSFSGLRPDETRDFMVNNRPLTNRILWLARGAIVGGTIILMGTLAAWTACLWRIANQREWSLLSLLLIPALAALVAVSFAIKYPYDTHGVIKGAYTQFGAPALFAMFGVAVEWALRSRRRWFVAGALLLSLAAVAAYATCCRTGLFQ